MTPDLSCCVSAQSSNPTAISERASALREDPRFAQWAGGLGVIVHDDLTQVRIDELLDTLVSTGRLQDRQDGLDQLCAADRLTSAAMWLVVHMTYAARVRLDGGALDAADFKREPEGHTGGALNMVPAYVGYLLMNSLDGVTRGWLMGQGHCVAAIDASNLLVGNTTPEHAERYALTEDGLGRFINDFYSYAQRPDGTQASPLGSHVNAHTAGGLLEGGYLGFAELQYVHAPLPGERLVAFLSDGAFEEQRGSDWSARWWRREDSGLVAPIMVMNGRRIEQRAQIAQQGGERWFDRHLRLNSFEPVGIDGRDPASVAWGIHAIERGLAERSVMFYGVAETVKGFGFPGAGTNRAHNLPLDGNPSEHAHARTSFNAGAGALYVAPGEIAGAARELGRHAAQVRPLERDNPFSSRRPVAVARPPFNESEPDATLSPMVALDHQFAAIVELNPMLRPRVGNPDELRSNRLDATLDLLKHRVDEPEAGIAESRTGGVITALNEEAVVCAALGNKGGLNLVVTYEAFAPKMLGAVRQEITFARQLRKAGRPPGWHGLPIVLTSHTWENAKNEISHQDPTFVEALLGEMSDSVRVVFPADANCSVAALRNAYSERGIVHAMVVPKRAMPVVFDRLQAESLATSGATIVSGSPENAEMLVIATGAYQLAAATRGAERLQARGVRVALLYLQEPGRFRFARDEVEATAVIAADSIARLFPPDTPRVFVTHTRPEPYIGLLRPIDTGRPTTRVLGFINRGGTLDVDGMLFANRSTWAHVVAAAADVSGRDRRDLLDTREVDAVAGHGDPRDLRS